MVTAGGETWSDAVARQIADYPDFRSKVATLLPAWTAAAKKGGKLGIGATATQLDQLSRVGSALAHPTSVHRLPGVFSTPAAGKTNAIHPMFVNVNDPNAWPVRGNRGGNGNTYWSNLQAVIAVAFCTSTCKTTDTIGSRSQVNPGAASDLISITQAYYPDAGTGDMDRSVEYSFKSINRSNVTGTGFNYLTFPAGTVGKSGAFTQRNGINYNKKVLTVAVGTGVVIYVPPYNGDRMWDGGKTNDASCSATTCHY